jgi:hypothetical protein
MFSRFESRAKTFEGGIATYAGRISIPSSGNPQEALESNSSSHFGVLKRCVSPHPQRHFLSDLCVKRFLQKISDPV